MKNSTYIQQFADDLKNQIDKTGTPSAGKLTQNKKVREIFTNVQLLSEINARIAKEIEFLTDREINVSTFLDRYEEIEKEFEAKLAKLTK